MIANLESWIDALRACRRWRGEFLPQVNDCTFPETDGSHLKMDRWNTSFLLGPGLFSGARLVSRRVVDANVIDQ